MQIGARRAYNFGAFRLDVDDRLLYRDGELVGLAPKAFDTLLLLVSNGGRVLAKDEMMKHLWPDSFVEEGTLAQYISVLRKALGDSAGWIENHPRRGYRFTGPVEEVAAAPVEPVVAVEAGAGVRRFWRWRPAGRFLLVWAGFGLVAAAGIWMGVRPRPLHSFESIAVLPFRTVSDEAGDYLADGITEALVTRLANLKGLRVVSYSRTRRFKGSTEEAAQIGKLLGVQGVIEGTVRIAAGQLRVSVHAVDARTGYTIWAIDRLEAKPEKLLEIEGQLAEAAARRVRGQLSSSERDRVTKSPASSAEAYDLVLRARRADTLTAVEMLERAVRLDPEYADAYGWLALAQLRTHNMWRAGPETLRKAILNANLALAKDPDSAIAVRALVHIHHAAGREVEGLILGRRTLESSPDDLDAMAAAGEAYFRNGLYDRAIPLYEKALAGDPSNREFRSQLARMYLYGGQEQKGLEVVAPLPLNQAGHFGMLLYAETGQMGKAVEIARAGSSRFPHAFSAYLEGHVLSVAGEHGGAREKWTRAADEGEALLAQHENAVGRGITAMIYARLGRADDALRNLERALAADRQNSVVLFFAAQTRALSGRRKEALDTLRAAVANGFLNLPMVEYHMRPGLSFHDLRDDPEFQSIRVELARRLGELRQRY